MNANIRYLNIGFMSGGHGKYQRVSLDIQVNTKTLEAQFVVRAARRMGQPLRAIHMGKDRVEAQEVYDSFCSK